jgi:hypothetical protein
MADEEAQPQAGNRLGDPCTTAIGSLTPSEQSIRCGIRGRSPRNSVYLLYDECVPGRSQHISESAEATRCDVASYISSFPFHGPGDNAFHRYLAAHGVHRLVLYAVLRSGHCSV